jgi:hypothetical protein
MADTKPKIFRDRQFNVAVTTDELNRIHAHAAARGMRPVDYGRARLLGAGGMNAKAEAARPHLDPLFVASISRLGNLLNQIARRLNTFGGPAPATLEPLLREIRDIISKGIPGDH